MPKVMQNGRRVRVPGTCWYDHNEAVEGKSQCRLCLLKKRLKYARRAKPLVRPTCLRCGRRGKMRWLGKLCHVCRRTVAKNPQAEVRNQYGR